MENRNSYTTFDRRVAWRRLLAWLLAAAIVACSLVVAAQMQRYDEMSQQRMSILCMAIVCIAVCTAAIIIVDRKFICSRYVHVACCAVIVIGVFEAIMGFCQLYGPVRSLNAYFAMTGTFYNPGPYGGFLAVAASVCFYYALVGRRVVRGAATFAMMVMAIALIASGSRTAWVASAVACLLVVWQLHRVLLIGWLKRYWAVAVAIVIALTVGCYVLKSDSANGRLLMWKVGVMACAAHPSGVGWYNVPGAYGDAQEAYFREQCGSETEAMVAGAPEYLFNEYLQVGLAWGIPAMIGLIAVIAASIAVARRCGNHGVAAGMAAFAVFAFASYPLQFPLFLLTLALLLLASFLPAVNFQTLHAKIGTLAALVCVAIVCAIGDCSYGRRDKACRQWADCRQLYAAGRYAEAADGMASLYGQMNWNVRFLFEYGHALHKSGRYAESNGVLRDALKVGSDAMILNIIGKNYHRLGLLDEARECLMRSAYRQPERMYPYYLMVLLASDPDGFDRDLLAFAGAKVLTMRPKVMSPAVVDMQRQVADILAKFHIDAKNVIPQNSEF